METNEVESRDLNEQCKCEAKHSDQQKLSYEELENVARQLSEQSKSLYAKLQEANMFNTFKRLDYLFKVVEFESSFNDVDFVAKCKSEIKDLMTVPEEIQNSENKED